MPLPDDEQRLLKQIEQDLGATDPKFAAQMSAGPGWFVVRWRAIMGSLALVAGLALVVLAAISGQIWLAVIGFAAMVAAGSRLLETLRHHSSA